ncbi:MAG: hypothetical protein HN757_10720 [Calditrichaeota bacterium]|nr:hypothetical protein [Calditrichota bacterium]
MPILQSRTTSNSTKIPSVDGWLDRNIQPAVLNELRFVKKLGQQVAQATHALDNTFKRRRED